MARPTKPPSETRSVSRNMRFTPTEAAAIDAAAEARGLKFVGYMRRQALSETQVANDTTPPSQHNQTSDHDRQMQEGVKRLGVNLNQIARQLNTHPNRPPPAELSPLLTEIRRYLARIL